MFLSYRSTFASLLIFVGTFGCVLASQYAYFSFGASVPPEWKAALLFANLGAFCLFVSVMVEDLGDNISLLGTGVIAGLLTFMLGILPHTEAMTLFGVYDLLGAFLVCAKMKSIFNAKDVWSFQELVRDARQK